MPRSRRKEPQTMEQFIEAIARAKATGGDWERLVRLFEEKFPKRCSWLTVIADYKAKREDYP